MASEFEIAAEVDTYLRARGYTCGRSYSNVGDVANGIAAKFPGEPQSQLAAKILRIGKDRPSEFKTRGEQISASRASDRDCGT